MARRLSNYRIAAYECAVGADGIARGKRVAGWYGLFDRARLADELIPWLVEYAGNRASFPFLVTSYSLEGKTDVTIAGDRRRAGSSNVQFRPRRRATPQRNEAVVFSRSRYELLA